ncbi:MAG: alcohol dehydrogenase catalytic domain-containing protein [Rubrobacter sp.]
MIQADKARQTQPDPIRSEVSEGGALKMRAEAQTATGGVEETARGFSWRNPMKAIVYTQYGSPDVLQLEEVEKPAPTDDEVLVRVHAASAAADDWHLLGTKPFLVRFMYGLLKPRHKILGADVAGRVEAVGRNVTQFQPGDGVFRRKRFGGVGCLF